MVRELLFVTLMAAQSQCSTSEDRKQVLHHRAGVESRVFAILEQVTE